MASKIDPGTKMSYYNVLSYIGDFGRYQKRMMVLVLITSVPFSVQTLLTVFTLGVPDFRCAVPDLENDTYEIQNVNHERLVNGSIPLDEVEGRYSQCKVFTVPMVPVNTSHGLVVKHNLTTQNCDSWVYSRDVYLSTLIMQLDIVCDRYIYSTHANMMTMAGLLVGSLFGGLIADVFGRKRPMLCFLFLHTLCSVSLAYVDKVPTLLALRFLMSAVGISYYVALFVLSTELVGPSWRSLAGMIIMIGWAVGMFVLVFFAYFIRDWQILQLSLSCPTILLMSLWWLLPESPRWLLQRGRDKEAAAILAKVANANKVDLPEKLVIDSREEGKNGTDQEIIQKDRKAERTGLLIFKSPILITRLFILALNWAVCSMVYYGLTLNVGAIVEGDIYINFLILSIIELSGYFLALFLLDRIGRKIVYCSSVFVGGLACLAIIIPLVTDTETAWINQLLSNIGKLGMTNAFAIIWLYSAELLPTVVRNSALGVCSVGGRIGGVVSPYIGSLHYLVGGNMGKALPLIIFGGTSVVAGILALFLPETAKRKLPDTIEDAEAMGRRKKNKKASY